METIRISGILGKNEISRYEEQDVWGKVLNVAKYSQQFAVLGPQRY